MKKAILCVLCCLMVCLAMSGCFTPPIPEPYGIMTPTKVLYDGLDLLKPQAQVPDVLTGDTGYCIVIDDGSGMKGFVSQYCSSYRAALTAVMGVSIGGERTYIRASQIASGSNQAGAVNESFLNDATKEEFFRDKTNDVASVIEELSKRYQPNANQVMILVSDLMIPTEDGCMKAASAIRKAFLVPQNATVGVICIIGDFRGTIENLPINSTNGRSRTIRDYMVAQRDEYGVFRHPLYIFFMGNDQAVLTAMEKAMADLKNSGQFDASNPIQALYFSEYDIVRCAKDDITYEFHTGYENYNSADYDVQFIVRGIQGENGLVKYKAPEEVSNEYQQILKSVKIMKLYTEKRGNSRENVMLYCTIPFTLTDSAQKGSITDRYKLLKPARYFSLSEKDYAVSVDIRTFQYRQEVDSAPVTSWEIPEETLIRCDSKKIDFEKGLVTVGLSVDTTLLKQDNPLLIRTSVSISADPQWEEIEPLYNMGWVDDLTLNLKEFEKEVNGLNASSSARFTYDSTAKTPFLSNLFIRGIGEQQIEITCDSIKSLTSAITQTNMFGIVVRNYPDRYIQNVSWKPDEDFDGWAFSYIEVNDMLNPGSTGK